MKTSQLYHEDGPKVSYRKQYEEFTSLSSQLTHVQGT